MAELRIPRPPQTCQRCGADFFIRPSKLKDGRGTYCSRACRYALSLEERFWANIDKTPGLGPHGECWEWRGVLASGGYGRLHTGPGTKYIRAHRFAWTLEHGPIPKGMDVLHKCDNPPCVRCLFLGTQLDNLRDRDKKSRFASKLTESDVIQIRSLYKTNRARKDELASQFGVCYDNIWYIVTGRTWKHLPL